jgi:hypothetical protein
LSAQREREQGEEEQRHGPAIRTFVEAAHNACSGLTHSGEYIEIGGA